MLWRKVTHFQRIDVALKVLSDQAQLDFFDKDERRSGERGYCKRTGYHNSEKPLNDAIASFLTIWQITDAPVIDFTIDV